MNLQRLSYRLRYAIFGALFGLMFPIVATLITAMENQTSFLEAQLQGDLLLWIINSAPFFLGLFASIAGAKQDRLTNLNQNLEHLVEERTRELKQSQDNLIVSEKMAALGTMAGGIAHEVNNPLAVIHGYGTMINTLIDQEPVDKKRIHEVTDKIVDTAMRVSKIAMALKGYARDQKSEEFTDVNLSNVIQSTIELSRSRLKEKDVDIRVEEISPDLTIRGRETELTQVLLNLFNNAIDAVEKSNDRWIKVRTVKEVGRKVIKVIDSGGGIPEETVKRMMDPFFTTKEVGKGTGLGLSISNKIVQRHGGKIAVDHKSKNTCFVITFPDKENQEAA